MTLQDDTDWYGLRFEGVGRLYGPHSLERLAASRVCVIGLGGVGSWAVEALARSGVGSLTLVDPDEVCISNTNRQLNALHGTVGRSKASVLAERVRASRASSRRLTSIRAACSMSSNSPRRWTTWDLAMSPT